MDARVAALESSVAALSDSIDSKMAMFFEQFRREQACARGTGGSTSDTDLPPQPLITDPPDPGDLVLIGLAITGNLASIFPDSLRLLRPSDVHDAISIALQLDAKLCDLKNGYTKPFPQPRVLHTPTTPPITSSVKPSNFTVKRLTPVEIQRKREKGECWFCDEKWRTGHNCANKQLLMLDLAYPEEEITTPLLEEPPPEFLQMELSECAFYGTFARTTVKTMKVIGSVNGQQVTVLLDSRSTHNFVDSRLLKKFAWHTQPTKPFEVMIADGGKVSSSGCCTDAALSIGGYECGVDLYSLPLGGCDIVLWVQWLSSVSPVLWDFQVLTMEFAKNGSQYKLIHSDTHAPLIQEVTLQQLDKEIFNSNLGLFIYSIEDNMVEACDLNPLQLKQL
ncbi:hypothetical protein FF1_026743 [Malus domestica]